MEAVGAQPRDKGRQVGNAREREVAAAAAAAATHNSTIDCRGQYISKNENNNKNRAELYKVNHETFLIYLFRKKNSRKRLEKVPLQQNT